MAELLESTARDGASERYLRSLRSVLTMFAKAFPAYTPTDFSASTIDDWLRSLKVGRSLATRTGGC